MLWWFYAERVRQLTVLNGDITRAQHADGTFLTDDEVLSAAGVRTQA